MLLSPECKVKAESALVSLNKSLNSIKFEEIHEFSSNLNLDWVIHRTSISNYSVITSDVDFGWIEVGTNLRLHNVESW